VDEHQTKRGPAWTAALVRAMADAFPLAFYVVDECSDTVLYANRRFFDLWGLGALESPLRRGSLADGQVIDRIRPLLKGGSHFPTNARPFSPDDQAVAEDELLLTDGRTIRRMSVILRDEGNVRWGRLHSFEDITEYRQTREALRESEERFKSFMDHTPALAWLKDEQGRYMYANRRWEEQFGFSRNEWRHLTDEMLYPFDLARQCREGDQEVLGSGKPYEAMEFSRDPSGTRRCWWIWKFPFQGGRGTRYVGGIAIDVTERTLAEQSLQESEQRYHALYEDNPTMYFTLAIDGTVLSVNRYGASQLGYAPHELIGDSVLDVFHREDHALVLEQLTACQKNVTKTISWELRKIRKDGTGLWVRECARAVPDPKGNLVVLVVCEDITERKLAEKALLRAQARMQAIQAERERLAHDLHDNIIQRLYAIGMGLEEGRYRIKDGAQALPVSGLLARTIGELNLVIDDVRNFIGGKDPLHLVNASTVAAQFRKLARKAARGPVITVQIDEGATEQMPTLEAKNLYLIAREAVSNILRHSRAAHGAVRLRAENDLLVLTIQDDGIGFEPARAAGRFGLKTMKARAKKIGARFRLRSRDRKGTVIMVELPKGSPQNG
jgi:PAS domain S-box-containing protein